MALAQVLGLQLEALTISLHNGPACALLPPLAVACPKLRKLDLELKSCTLDAVNDLARLRGLRELRLSLPAAPPGAAREHRLILACWVLA